MKHSFKTEKGEKYYCSNHYCDGHIDEFIVCSCGWKIKNYNSINDKYFADIQKIKHVLEAEGLMG